MPTVAQHNLRAALRECFNPQANICADEAAGYFGVGKEFASHGAVNHVGGEYVRGAVHVNSCESFSALLKRGVYHHWSQQQLHRYLSEYDFRRNFRKVGDGERTLQALKGVEGERLMYKDPVKSYWIKRRRLRRQIWVC